MGQQGLKGPIGGKGPTGMMGNPSSSRGYLFTRHSQNTRIPLCPNNSTKLWTGYSLLYFLSQDSEHSHGQDLGGPGSCLPRFSTLPYITCEDDDSCTYAIKNDYSYWLSTRARKPLSNIPIVDIGIKEYISRCTVCESRTQVIAVHSQSINVPVCPNNWETLWIGYSFVMNTDAGGEGSGQSLNSPGSCLEEFRHHPFIECHGHGRCNYYTTAYSFWLIALDTLNSKSYYGQKVEIPIDKEEHMKFVSRCAVCRRRTTGLYPMTYESRGIPQSPVLGGDGQQRPYYQE